MNADETPIDDMPLDDAIDDDVMNMDLEFETAFGAVERNDRNWIRAIMPILQAVTKECPDGVSHSVRRAYDDMMLAACERAARIFRADIPVDDA